MLLIVLLLLELVLLLLLLFPRTNPEFPTIFDEFTLAFPYCIPETNCICGIDFLYRSNADEAL